ncbi:MAG: hypothetical protein Tsb0017_11590 [Geothermobacteraceae bacterium]
MKKVALIILAVLLSSCSYSISEIDVSKFEQSCVRECSKSYSSCVSQGNQIGFKTETLRACRESYQVCVNTCPTKQ